ncbi:MAG: hypothetical protein HZA94_03630 [Candidatus Vogelbacteria bacterium]|nr:hypothetical protein [Candidatus Vogelbacteria bacterium]
MEKLPQHSFKAGGLSKEYQEKASGFFGTLRFFESKNQTMSQERATEIETVIAS